MHFRRPSRCRVIANVDCKLQRIDRPTPHVMMTSSSVVRQTCGWVRSSSNHNFIYLFFPFLSVSFLVFLPLYPISTMLRFAAAAATAATRRTTLVPSLVGKGRQEPRVLLRSSLGQRQDYWRSFSSSSDGDDGKNGGDDNNNSNNNINFLLICFDFLVANSDFRFQFDWIVIRIGNRKIFRIIFYG